VINPKANNGLLQPRLQHDDDDDDEFTSLSAAHHYSVDMYTKTSCDDITIPEL